MNELEKAIEDTKLYAGRYGQRLNDKQLFLRLISNKIFSYRAIKGQGENVQSDKEWLLKISKAKKFASEYLSKMEGIEMVGITGSVAAESAKINEDIDLLIVTKKDELWWWRLYLRLYVWFKGIPHRKYGEKEKKDEFCFNLWLDNGNLTIPKEKRNLKNATDLIMMKIILEKNNTYQKFLNQNYWVNDFLATGYNKLIDNNSQAISKGSNILCKMGNRIIFFGQYIYMWSKQRQKLKNIELGQAFFHKES